MGEQDAILVIDHDPAAALLLSDFLEREGYAVAVARTGGEGLRLIRLGTFASSCSISICLTSRVRASCARPHGARRRPR